jgi:hypothetical protein
VKVPVTVRIKPGVAPEPTRICVCPGIFDGM